MLKTFTPLWLFAFPYLCINIAIHSEGSAVTRFKESDCARYIATSNKDYSVYQRVSKIPKLVSDTLAVMFKSKYLEMADPGQPFQETDVLSGESLPERRLVFLATSKEYCVLHYEKGGFVHHYVVLIFEFENENARLIYGGGLYRELPDLGAIKAALKSKTMITEWIEMNW